MVILEDKSLHLRLRRMCLDMQKRLRCECYLNFDNGLLRILRENSEFSGPFIENANFQHNMIFHILCYL